MAGFIVIITMGNDLKKNFNNDLDLLGGATIIKAMFEYSPTEPQEWFRDQTMAAMARIPGVLDTTRVATKGSAVISWARPLVFLHAVRLRGQLLEPDVV